MQGGKTRTQKSRADKILNDPGSEETFGAEDMFRYTHLGRQQRDN
jgi:hypothetical protein